MTEFKQYRSIAAEARELRDINPGKADELMRQLQAMEQKIEALPSDQRRLMRMRYINGYRWVKISQKMCYSRSETFRIHRKALDNLK